MMATALAGMPRLVDLGAAHCEVAQRLAERLGFGHDVQIALGQVFERWDGKGVPRGLRREAIARSVRIVQLAQDAVVSHRLGGVDAAVARARQRAGGAYDPRVVEAFYREAARLLSDPEDGSAWTAVLALEPGEQLELGPERLDEAIRAAADFADLKSPVLSGHSSGVAALASEAARRCRLPEQGVVAVRWAGFLHDLGRVGVTAAIWGKTGPLSDAEWERVRLHPYYTERVLQRAPALAGPGALAAAHHERLDGSGYHRGSSAPQLPVAARLLAAADVYQALTEPRPHRPAASPEQAATDLHQEARVGRLDPDAVAAVVEAAGHRVRAVRRTWPAGLTEREVEVLRLLARGCTVRQVAARLVVAPATADHHVRHIYGKLAVSTRAAATLFALQHNLLDGAEAEK